MQRPAMWQYRELIGNLTVVEFKNRYQNTSLGFLWSVLSPFLLAGVLFFVFRFMFGQEKNYAANLLVGIMAWRFFSLGTNASLYSVLSRPSLVTKVYIPRNLLVLSTALSSLTSACLEFVVILPLIFVITGGLPATFILFLPLHMVSFFLVYGIGLALGSLVVYFRDLNQIWEVLINVLFFCSPIVYPLSIVPKYLMDFYLLNPITQMVVSYQRLMVAGEFLSIRGIAVLVVSAGVAFVAGGAIFNRLQRRFAEEL